MQKFGLVLAFVVLTFLSWGLYGPILHEGQREMNNSLWRPFICVGMAYFVVAVVVPTLILRAKGESGKWTAAGLLWSLLAGGFGAIGALGIVCAFKFKGNPVYVMPLVFGGAPVVNTLVTMYVAKTTNKVSWLFIAAVLIVAMGAGGVLVFKPKPAVTAPKVEVSIVKSSVAHTVAAEVEDEANHATVRPGMTLGQLLAVMASIFVTACCWGAYGPTLHHGQAAMQGSRLRPLICVGLAYFVVAVIIPVMLLSAVSEQGNWTFTGSLWSLVAGTLAAVGALGIIMAFTFGGKPIYVMPLVFGGAPVINTAASVTSGWLHHGTIGTFRPQFFVSLAMVALGAACVMVFAPRPIPPAKNPTPGEPVLPPLSPERSANEETPAAEL